MAGPEERGGRGAGGSGEAQGQGQPRDSAMAPMQPSLGPPRDEPRVSGLDKTSAAVSWRVRMAPGQQASAKGMAVEGAEDEGEAYLAAKSSVEAAGVVDTAATTRATDVVMADSTASATIVTRADICGTIASSSLMDGPMLKAKRVEEQEKGEEEAVEAMAVAEVVLQI
ncbi:unnamed protein product [Closterium sp. NIES-54]